MINRDILEAQIKLYENGRIKALEAFEKVKADINAFNGAIEACNHLLSILSKFEEAEKEQKEKSVISKQTKEETK